MNPVTRCARCTSSTPISFAETEFVLRAEGTQWRLPLCWAHYESLMRTIRRWTVNAAPDEPLPLTILNPPVRAPVPPSRNIGNHPAGRHRVKYLRPLGDEGVQDNP